MVNDLTPYSVAAAGDRSANAAYQRAKSRRRIVILAKCAISILLTVLLLSYIDIDVLVLHFVSVPTWVVGSSLFVLFLQLVILSIRWDVLNKAIDLATSALLCVRFTLEGYFFNQALISSIGGDAIRMMRLAKVTGRTRRSIESVFLDRFVGMVSLFLLIGFMFPVLVSLIEDPLLLLCFALIIFGALFGVVLFALLPLLPERWKYVSIVRDVVGLSLTARKLAIPRTSIALVAMSLLGHCLTGVVFWILALGSGVSLSLIHAIVLIPAALLATLLPVSIAGWGVREGSVVYILSFVGISTEAAFALSVVYGLLMVVVALPGGPLWLLRAR